MEGFNGSSSSSLKPNQKSPKPQTTSNPKRKNFDEREANGLVYKKMKFSENYASGKQRICLTNPIMMAAKKPVAGFQTKPTTTVTLSTAQSAKTEKPPLDVKSHPQIMEDKVLHQGEHNSNLQKEIELRNEKLNMALDEMVKASARESSEARAQIHALQKKLSLTEKKRQNLEQSMLVIKKQKDDLEKDLKVNKNYASGLQQSMAKTLSTIVVEKEKAKQHETKMKDKDSTINKLKGDISRLKQELDESRNKLEIEEKMRRMPQKTIKESKSVKLFARIRPLLGERGRNSQPIITVDNDKSIVFLQKLQPVSQDENGASRVRMAGQADKLAFDFDRIFDQSSSQKEVFEEISQLVRSALLGRNSSIICYGQTGAGKTYTIEGRDEEEEEEGLIQRSAKKIFSEIEELKKKGWKFEVEVSFLQFYDENVRDLLSSREDLKCDVRWDRRSNESYVTNIVRCQVTDIEEVKILLKISSNNRSTKKCNERSSRSHNVFSMKIMGSYDVTKESRVGMINLVDVAGTEHLKYYGSHGARMREMKSTNRSLATLSNVIISLANEESRIQWKNSKLTHALQTSLSKNTELAIIIHLNPSQQSYQETFKNLMFSMEMNCQGLLVTKQQIDRKLSDIQPEQRQHAIRSIATTISETAVKFVSNLDLDFLENRAYKNALSAWNQNSSSTLDLVFIDLEFTADKGGFRAVELKAVVVGIQEFIKAQRTHHNQQNPDKLFVRYQEKLSLLLNPLVDFRSKSSNLCSERLRNMKILDDETIQLLSSFFAKFKDVCIISHSQQDLQILLAEALSLRCDISQLRDVLFLDTDRMFQALLPGRQSYKLESIYSTFFNQSPKNQHCAEYDATTLLLCCIREKNFIWFISQHVGSIKEVIPHTLKCRR